jgi:hypothetical protein
MARYNTASFQQQQQKKPTMHAKKGKKEQSVKTK